MLEKEREREEETEINGKPDGEVEVNLEESKKVEDKTIMNQISLRKITSYNDNDLTDKNPNYLTYHFNLIANTDDDYVLTPLLFSTQNQNNTIYDNFYSEYDESEETFNIIVLTNDGISDFTEYELNIPSYFGDSYEITNTGDDVALEQIVEQGVEMDIIIVGGGSAGQSFTISDFNPPNNVETGSGGSGGAIIRKSNYIFGPGIYRIGVGKGGTGYVAGEGDENDKSGKGSYLKKPDSDDQQSNNFIYFACGGLYKNPELTQIKISKSGGNLGIVNSYDYTDRDNYKTINNNIITSQSDGSGLLLNSNVEYSTGGRGGRIDIGDLSAIDEGRFFITNILTDNTGYKAYYSQIIGSSTYSSSNKNGKQGSNILLNKNNLNLII